MIDRSVRRQFVIFLAVVGWLGLGLQTAGQRSVPEATTEALGCGGGAWVVAPVSPTETEGEGPSWEGYAPADPAFLPASAPTAALPQQRRLLATSRTVLPEGFPAEIERPPIGVL